LHDDFKRDWEVLPAEDHAIDHQSFQNEDHMTNDYLDHLNSFVYARPQHQQGLHQDHNDDLRGQADEGPEECRRQQTYLHQRPYLHEEEWGGHVSLLEEDHGYGGVTLKESHGYPSRASVDPHDNAEWLDDGAEWLDDSNAAWFAGEEEVDLPCEVEKRSPDWYDRLSCLDELEPGQLQQERLASFDVREATYPTDEDLVDFWKK
jgi:hypothetical protein